jgi:hypothetical protein
MILKQNSELKNNNKFIIQDYTTHLSNNNINPSGEIPFIQQWLQNSQFDTEQFWDLIIDSASPLDDVDGFIEGGHANIIIIGEQHTYNKSWDLTNSQNQTGWEVDSRPKWAYSSPNINASAIYPDSFGNDSRGLWASHYWDEGADQIAVVNWNYTINLDHDMRDYNIIFASLTATFNATVQARWSTDNSSTQYTGAIDVQTDAGLPYQDPVQGYYGQTGDFVRFFVLISDMDYINSNEVAYNQTSKLGQDIPEISDITDGVMTTELEEELIADINSALKNNYRNFTISVGMYIKCEDNFHQDADNWELLSITGLNFTFTYEKVINKDTTISWSQQGGKITGENTIITGADLSFNYKLDKNWTDRSEFSELRMFINNNEYDEPILLSEYIYSDDYISAGFDLTNLVPKDQNITLSIQLYLANTFDLTENITISLDNVYLQISYVQIYPDIAISEATNEPWFYAALFLGAAAIAGGLGTYLVLYYTIFRYPKPIRKLRNYRKSLKKGEMPRNLSITSREEAFKSKM